MNHNIQIFRPTDRRSAFDGVPEGERAMIHETTYTSDREDWAAERIAEQMFRGSSRVHLLVLHRMQSDDL